ncbi:dual specificity tyrosine-phosphorylation-regulated kinase 2-like [Physella acuta]|uniref:dual specificity tyrosine-phosphorylation-regulated kinase 2-like n=1 Tax=Physella acuta TaxID=109671 RepID=UPI0027DCEEF6|nr:dual specificity tyrosine-phosphorylation-regulated kinase 2-like [Physella acuta]XP_059142537.1 dual specificity tyrosine-phosphorylation-regulated kinase 2-like [Physella acuta]XP_059142538.1 dual specificity tyrosine-phosphorylation-regulated kinase 2-like [Physella acuta]XP_059142539.1 dual specificity tyrosine-phosphorylation-regulated kinase 2-like [Physella acuta]
MMEKRGVVIQQMFEDPTTSSSVTKASNYRSSKSTSKAKLTVPNTREHMTLSSSSVSMSVTSTESLKVQTVKSTEKIRKKSTKPSLVATSSSKLLPSAALSMFGNKLTAYEQEEIRDYQSVYCLGLNASKLNNGPIPSKESDVYDDDDHFYKVVPRDHIAYRYEVSDKPSLGKGTFGQVIKAYDHKLHKYVALKLVRNERIYLKQSREELRILQTLKRQDIDNTYNIVIINEFFMFRNHMVISFELLGMNLYQVLKRNNYRGLGMSRILPITRCVLRCLELLFKNRIIHCDIKPENIMLKKNGDFTSVKVGDFGSSCYEQQQIYHYIQSRYYRAPEVILGMRYGPAIDMWSLGCVLGELSTGLPIFVGADEDDQLAAIEEMLGEVPQVLLNKARPKPRSGKRKKNRGLPGTKNINTVLIGDDLFKDFVKQLLEWDPIMRPTPLEMNDHPWMNKAVSAGSSLFSGFKKGGHT